MKNFSGDAGTIAAVLRVRDANAKVAGDVVAGQVDVSAQPTSGQVIIALKEAGYETSRVSQPQQIHVSCGSCS